MHKMWGNQMDIVLERIKQLIPQKPNGDFVHGAIKEFAESIGVSGNLVTTWFSGKSESYKKKLYQIASVYNVSVDWLEGKTDDPKPAPSASGDPELDAYLQELATRSEMRMLFSVSKRATKEQIEAIVHMIEAMQGGNKHE